MNNIISFPSQLSKLKNLNKFRQYCLTPKGYTVKQTNFMPKPQKVDKFVSHTVQLYRPEKPIEKNTITFKLGNINLQKPEIKQYLTKIYGLDIKKIHTLRTMGKIGWGPFYKKMRQRDWKKAYVVLNNDVDQYYQKIEKL